jgi:hypothetical protein
LDGNSFLGPWNNLLDSTVCSVKAKRLLVECAINVQMSCFKLPSLGWRRTAIPPYRPLPLEIWDISGLHSRSSSQNHCRASGNSLVLCLATF